LRADPSRTLASCSPFVHLRESSYTGAQEIVLVAPSATVTAGVTITTPNT
jgi:hypothetical protein